MPAITKPLANVVLASVECDTTRPCDASCAMCYALTHLGTKTVTK